MTNALSIPRAITRETDEPPPPVFNPDGTPPTTPHGPKTPPPELPHFADGVEFSIDR